MQAEIGTTDFAFFIFIVFFSVKIRLSSGGLRVVSTQILKITKVLLLPVRNRMLPWEAPVQRWRSGCHRRSIQREFPFVSATKDSVG